jgi:cytochrome P450
MIFSYGPRACLGKEYHVSVDEITNIRMALLELRMLLSALVMKYTWAGVPDKPGNWDEEMKPFDTMVLHPWNEKCVLKLEPRV